MIQTNKLKTMKNLSTIRQLNIASISDIHLGHPTNHTEDIVTNLKIAFPDNTETAMLDYIFFCGDVFDRLLTLPESDVLFIKEFIAYILKLCKKHNIKLRVLEGTPSHDWYQSQAFQDINVLLEIGADLKYFKQLHIEYEQDHDIWLLFVPDECDATTEKTLSRVKNLIEQNGIEKVDYALMHGQFEYQLPEFVKAPKHNSEEYLNLVKHVIFIGHVHTFSQRDRIVAHGSFDRLRQNEESPKGHVRVKQFGNDLQITFVENKGAKIYKTIDCTGLDINALLEKIDSVVFSAREDSYFRVRAEVGHPIFSNMEVLIRRYPLYKWDKITNEEINDKVKVIEEEAEDETFEPLIINANSVVALMEERLKQLQYNEEVIHDTMFLFKQGVNDYGY